MHPMKTIAKALLLLLMVTPVLAQEFQIRARIDLVVVPFSVKGEGNALISGMGEEDFTVLEDNVEQSIVGFSDEPIPLSAAVVIDTGVDAESLAAIQEAIPAVVFGFSAFDEVALYRYDNTVMQVEDFTDDPEVLRTALDKLKQFRPGPQFVGGTPAQPGPVINGIPSINTARIPLGRDTRVLHDAIYEAALGLRDRPDDGRRKIIVIVSDGNDTRSVQSMDDNILFLIDSKVQVYSIALETGFFGRLFNTLDDYSRLSGGDIYHVGNTELGPAFPQVMEEARNQYVLTYISSNEAPSDTIVFRRIEVLSEDPYDIVHRAGYYQVP
jgi:VWFA-related protein